MKGLVDRFGKTGFAALASVIWALPMAAWAGSSDLSPIDTTAYPRVALTVGVVMFAAWLLLLTRIARTATAPRRHRLEIGQMSTLERRWALACFACACGVIAWLNAAATVDWSPLVVAASRGNGAATTVSAVLVAALIALATGAALTWRAWSRAFARRP